ncbi:MAG: HupE/UreJ family protein [Acidobacteria bacterium]|nr:HupE/UreJ family protein [Acidobacteriota bacterium]
MLSRVAALVGLAVLVAVRSASAHPAPFSFLDLVIRDDAVHGTLSLHVVDVAYELKIDPAERLLDPAEIARMRDRVAALVEPRLRVRADVDAPIEWLGMEPASDRHAVVLRFRIPVPRPGALYVRSHIFPYDPVHQTFVNIYEGDELWQQLIFNAASEEYVYYTGTTQGAFAVMRTFIPAGIHHIMIGPDHVLFLVGLLLLGGSWLALLKIVTAFTVGHSITLSLAALGIIMPSPRVIEPAIALSIIFVGADNLVRGAGRDVRAWVALVFGLVHGFGFANVLREFGLPGQALGWSLFSFNFGVEIGQLGVVLLVATALEVIRRRNHALGHRVAWGGSIVVIAAGTYWFVERVFFPTGA